MKICKSKLDEVFSDVKFQKKGIRILKKLNDLGEKRGDTKPLFIGEIPFEAAITIKYKTGSSVSPTYDIRNDEIVSIKIVYEKHHDEFKYVSYCKFYALLKLKNNREIPYLIYCSKEKNHNRFEDLKNIFYSADSTIKFVHFREKNEFSNFKILMDKTREYLKTTFNIE